MADRRFDVAAAAVGAVLLVGAWLVALAGPVPGWEVRAFRWWNDLPDVVSTVLWAPMQLGSLAGPMVVAAGAVIVTMRARPAVDVLLAALVAWLAARSIKELVERGRPEALLADVALRSTDVDGFGFVSGHAAVAFAIATALAADLAPRWRVVAYATATIVAVARMVHGVHFPADVVGGAGLGLLCGVAARRTLDAIGARRAGDPADAG